MGRSRSSRAKNGVGEDDDVSRPLKKRDSRHKPKEETREHSEDENQQREDPIGNDAETDAKLDAETDDKLDAKDDAKDVDSEPDNDKDASSHRDDDDDDDDDDDEEYEVESIVDMKKVKGKVHYLIRWKGYQSESDTWEPEDTLSCPELIADFKEKQTNGKPKTSTKRKGTKRDHGKEKRQKTSKKPGARKGSLKRDADENNEYEVEKIVEVHHKKNGSREFLIKWKGWEPKHNTWEPEKNLSCPDLIQKFMEKVSEKKSTTPKGLRVAPSTTKRFTLAMKNSGRRLSKRHGNKQRVRYDDAE